MGYLTKSEAKVAFMVLNGKTAKETARVLLVSHKTVEKHLANIKKKLSCQNKAELIRKLLLYIDFSTY